MCVTQWDRPAEYAGAIYILRANESTNNDDGSGGFGGRVIRTRQTRTCSSQSLSTPAVTSSARTVSVHGRGGGSGCNSARARASATGSSTCTLAIVHGISTTRLEDDTGTTIPPPIHAVHSFA